MNSIRYGIKPVFINFNIFFIELRMALLIKTKTKIQFWLIKVF